MDMASKAVSTSAQVRQCEVLAQRLYGQCRDSQSSYRELTSRVRTLRNILGEIDENLDGHVGSGAEDMMLLCRLVDVKSILEKLDIALVSFKLTNQINVDNNLIAGFKSSVDVVTRDLLQASQNTAHGYERSSSSLASALTPKGSESSNAWPAVKTERSIDPSEESNLSNEKEVCQPESIYQRSSAPELPQNGASPFPSWRDIFIQPEPLSLPFEDAANLILFGDNINAGPGDENLSPSREQSSATEAITDTPDKPAEQATDSAEEYVHQNSVIATAVTTSKHRTSVTEEMGAKLPHLVSMLPNGEQHGQVQAQDQRPVTVTESKSNEFSVIYSGSTGDQSAAEKRHVPSCPAVVNENDITDPAISDVVKWSERYPDGVGQKGADELYIQLLSSDETISAEQAPHSYEPDDESLANFDHDEAISCSPAIIIIRTEHFDQYTEPDDSRLPKIATATGGVEAVTLDVEEAKMAEQAFIDYKAHDTVTTDEDSTSTARYPEIPTHPPPSPPSPIISKHEMPQNVHIAASLHTLDRPPSPTATESSEDLYYSTPPRNIKPILDEATLYPKPLKVSHTRSISLKVGDNQSGEIGSGERKRSKSATGLRRSRYYGYNATNEPKHLPTAPIADQGPPISHVQLSDVLTKPENDADGQEESSTKTHSALQVPITLSRYRKDRRNSAPPSTSVPSAAPGLSRYRVASTGRSEIDLEKSPAVRLKLPTPPYRQRKSVDDVLIRSKTPEDKLTLTSGSPVSERLNESQALSEDDARLAHENAHMIASYWNRRDWDSAETAIRAHLKSFRAGRETEAVRRAHHLLAVCSSFRGNWPAAIQRFMRVLRRPVHDLSTLDDGDCAAAYWLGDLYAMLNRRADALLAYSIAERASQMRDPSSPASLLALSAEQAAVRWGVSKADYEQRWSQESSPDNNVNDDMPSLVDPRILSVEAAKQLLENMYHEEESGNIDKSSQLTAGHSRSSHLKGLQRSSSSVGLPYEHRDMKIHPDAFDPTSPWPMRHDPLFCMAHVQRGRLLGAECDMLATFQMNADAKLPRPLSLSKIDCFTCNDLSWLIIMIRNCLRTYEMEHSEVINTQGFWFYCRYSFIQSKIATTHYFSISLFKHPFRSGYGMDVCSEEGMYSARIVGGVNFNHDRDVQGSEPKRIKKLIRTYLDEAAKLRKEGVRASTELAPPPLPSRPTSVY